MTQRKRQSVYRYKKDGSAEWCGHFVPETSFYWDEPRDINIDGAAIGRVTGKEHSRSRLWLTNMSTPHKWVIETWRITDGGIPKPGRCRFADDKQAADWFKKAGMVAWLRQTSQDIYNNLHSLLVEDAK